VEGEEKAIWDYKNVSASQQLCFNFKALRNTICFLVNGIALKYGCSYSE
jgi:hypothetical protein